MTDGASRIAREKGNNMKRRLHLTLVPLFATTFLSAQTLIIPQAPDGQNWRFTLVVTNTTTAAAMASITFFQSINATGDTTSWSPPLDANVANLEVPAASSVFVHSSGTAAALTQGWAQVTSNPPGALQAYVIYTYRLPRETDFRWHRASHFLRYPLSGALRSDRQPRHGIGRGESELEPHFHLREL